MRRHLLFGSLVLGALAGAARCSCEDGGGGAPGGGGGGGTAVSGPPSCPLDLEPYLLPSGSGRVRAIAIGSGDLLIGGEAASGRVGDFLLENDELRAIVQGSDRSIGANPYGGNLIDADVVRPAGEPGRDVVGEIAPFFNFGRTTDPDTADRVFVLADGSDGRGAVVAVNARDTQNDFINLAGMIGRLIAGATLAIDSEVDLPLDITTYWVLAPGERRLRYLTALCNTGTSPVVVAVGDLVDSGGRVDQFNPHSGTEGWHAEFLPTDAPWTAFEGDGAAYALVPGDGGQRNQALTVSGVTGTLQGSSSLFDYLAEIDLDAPPDGALRIPPGRSARYERQVVVGRTLGDVTDVIFAGRGEETGRLSVHVSAGGRQNPVAGAKVAALRRRDVNGAEKLVTETVFTTGADGTCSGVLPAGTYRLSADLPGRLGPEVEVAVPAGGTAAVELEVPVAGTLAVHVRDLAGNPLPGRVLVLCTGTCPTERAAEKRHRNVLFDSWPAGVVAIGHAGVSGDLSFELAPGAYQVLVSRGAEYDTFPVAWPQTREGAPVTIAAGAAAEVTAPLARVIDTTGWVSADFHVHAINSPDSPVPNLERVTGFVAQNVEVLVATDHDFVTDLAPYVEQLGAQGLVRTIVGDEITTFDFGHFNAFPLQVDARSLNGGAVDWAGGRAETLAPGEIFEAARDRGAQVVQVNHARGALGLFDAIELDTGTGETHADPVSFRMKPTGGDPAVDSRLFSSEFTAMELINSGSGIGAEAFHTLLNDWFTFLSRGLLVTGTAVSDTHKWAQSGPGTARSWVQLGVDDPADVDPAALAAAINAHRVIGSSAPFVTVEATSGLARASIGDTLATAGNPVQLRVRVQAPRWAPFNRIEVYSHREGTASTGGVANTQLPLDAVAAQADGSPARFRVDLADPAYTVDGAEGGAAHPAHAVEHTFAFAPAADTFYVVVVRAVATAEQGLEDGETPPAALQPISFAAGDGVRALAVANPVFIDVDGGGYDAFPLRRLPPPRRAPAPGLTLPQPVKRFVTQAELLELLERLAHD